MTIPEPEAKHLITGNETLVVLEYPEELPEQSIHQMKAELCRLHGVSKCLILTGGITLETVDEETMRRLGWVRAPKEGGSQ